MNIGLLEKGVNKNIESFIYTTREEAEYYRSIFGGHIITIQKIEEKEEYVEEWQETMFGDAQLALTKTINGFITDGDVYYVLNISKQATLTNGFRYTKELVIQNHNFKIYNDAKILNDNDINIYIVKTDAFTIKETDLEKVKELLLFSKNIGGWRFSKDDGIKFPNEQLTLLKNNEIKIKPVEVKKLNVIDEWDNNEICKLFEEHKVVIVRAEYGGSGKSYACAHMAKLGYKVLFVSPTNILCKELIKDYNIDAITINKFFGFGVNEENNFVKQFDATEYNCIIFDEI